MLAELGRRGLRGSSSLVDRLPQCVHQRVARKPEVHELDLYSILYWSRVLDRNVGAQPVQTREDRAESDGKVFRLKIGHGECHDAVPTRRGKCGCVHSPTSVGTAVSQGRVPSAWAPRDRGEELLHSSDAKGGSSGQRLLKQAGAESKSGLARAWALMPETLSSPSRIPGASQFRFPSLDGGHCLSLHMVLLRMQRRSRFGKIKRPSTVFLRGLVGWSVATRHEGAAFRQSSVEWPNQTGPP